MALPHDTKRGLRTERTLSRLAKNHKEGRFGVEGFLEGVKRSVRVPMMLCRMLIGISCKGVEGRGGNGTGLQVPRGYRCRVVLLGS